ncbi:MAG: 1-(5-phosphoribosyl)-5-[(5-phosphoribosylamino)methylideneamino] imidazole-4-carboxamide isomerase [Thaumarchaeota archaeon]|nr:1-(5-phosphoribosyl)-5-[(5-phosphoribosylamino)methylideneamino] imidazole-4-carboxamide isomerase [Candidatus Calditenuaceae archaeon]MDW8187197.1 1-(5-phosphoribosyl)-5-[(5-phosphoribosylamino)methylideneamino] imidazole-4-carboxamide isomerase [Nitrososphaerota archaeon]
MEVWASIDILEGNVVRLVRGEISNAIVYSTNPLQVARRLMNYGFDGIHLVDLDRAMGRGNNIELIKRLIQEFRGIRVQVGGGMRDRRSIEEVLSVGAERVVLGTLVFTEPNVVAALISDHSPERFVAALDYDHTGRILIRGWSSAANMELSKGYELVTNLSIRYVLATSTFRDGTLLGPDLETLSALDPEQLSMTYVSGGVSTVEHVRTLSSVGVKGVILGRVLYENLVHPLSLISAARAISVSRGGPT